MADLTAAAIRSLNADFVRKGIVITSEDDTAAASGRHALDPKILRLVEALKGSCKATTSKDMNEITAAIQHWKERSLHHTLQSLDSAATAAAMGTERQIQAIELHEKAGREVKDAVAKVIQGMVDSTLRQIDSFTSQLTTVIRELLKPEVEDELARERAISKRLIEEKQRLVQEQSVLEQTNAALQSRVEALENEPEGSGDAILCRKLRAQVRELTLQLQDKQQRMEQMQRDHEQWRYEVTRMREEMDLQQRTLTITRAMHEKETKQLTDLVHAREDRFQQVKAATAVAVGTLTNRDLAAYDAHSGQTIFYRNNSSPTKTSTTRLVQLPPAARSPPPQRRSSAPATSPNKKRLVSPTHSKTSKPPPLDLDLELDGSTVTASTMTPSPRATVSRPFSSPHKM